MHNELDNPIKLMKDNPSHKFLEQFSLEFVSHKASLSGKFDGTKVSRRTELVQRPQLLV